MHVNNMLLILNAIIGQLQCFLNAFMLQIKRPKFMDGIADICDILAIMDRKYFLETRLTNIS